MVRYSLLTLLFGLVVAGCGSAPAGPSSVSTSSTSTFTVSAATQAAVSSTVTQSSLQVALLGSIGPSNAITMPCPDSGSMTLAFTATPPAFGAQTFVSTSRTEFNDCRSQAVLIQGDPYLETTSEHTAPAPSGGVLTSMTSTMKTTGGLRFTANGVQGRTQYNCQQVVTMQMVNGTLQFQMTSSGSITWEQPVGSTPIVRPCGPSTP